MASRMWCSKFIRCASQGILSGSVASEMSAQIQPLRLLGWNGGAAPLYARALSQRVESQSGGLGMWRGSLPLLAAAQQATSTVTAQAPAFMDPTLNRLEWQRRNISTSAATFQQSGGGEVARRSGGQRDDITDVIPPKPVGAVEGTSYMLVILAGLAIAAGAAYAVLSELLFSPKEMEIFNLALARLETDPRVGVRIGSPMTGYGSEGHSRRSRQHIRHREYWGPDNYEHMAVQFFVRGPNGSAAVHADMFKDENKEWKFQYLYLELHSGVRIIVESPP